MKKLKIDENLFLIEREVTHPVQSSKTEVVSSDNLNHIWIFDRSGSMQGVLNSLVQDLIEKSKALKKGDVISVGWFSGESQYRFALKGFKVSEDKDFQTIESALNALRHTVGMTCFSEILYDAETVIKELSIFNLDFSLMFLTDGYPVVSNYNREVKNIFDAIEKIQNKIASSLLVGYGNYYNKELMAQMTQAFGGNLIHSSNMLSFSQDFNAYIEDSRENGAKIKVTVSEDTQCPFSINARQVNVYSINDEEGCLYFTPSKNKTNYLYYLSERDIPDADQIDADFTKDKLSQEETRFMKALYALSYILSSRTKTDVALKVLSKIGDVALLSGIVNAFTNEEYGEVESRIKKAVYSTKDRFTKGKDLNFLPDENATCIVDIADILTQDDETLFYPYHEDSEYQRIGKKSVQKEDTLKFKTNVDNPAVPLIDLVWNQTKLNLSLRIKIDGYVELGEKAESLGLAQKYPTYIWRNYTLVKDGFLNMSIIYITPSESTLKKIREIEVKENKQVIWELEDNIYKLELNAFPVMNRAMAKNNNSATELCKLSVQELELESDIKVAKALLKKYEKEEDKFNKVVTPEALTFLETVGIGKDGSFSPKTTTLPPTDHYFAKEFKIDIAKFSTLPSIDKVRDKYESIQKDDKGKVKFTESEQFVWNSIQNVEASINISPDDKVKHTILLSGLDRLKKQLKETRSKIQRTKFAIILGKQSFKEFESRDENTLQVGDFNFKISVREVVVNI